MNIIYCRWGSICEDGIMNAFKRLKHNIIDFHRLFDSVDYDKAYLKALADCIQANPGTDCVFSVNFQPIVARVCKVFKLPYISWTVDCPSFQLYSETITYPTNRIFVLDKLQAQKFAPMNPDNIYHMPMACDLATWDSVKITAADHREYDCDISFVGSLYSEKCKYNFIENDLPEHMQGYVKGLVDAQLQVYGYNLIEDSITDQWAADFKKYVGWVPLGDDYIEDVKGIVADMYIGEKCTEQERIRTLKAISESFNMDFYTLSDTSMLPKINNRGGADSNRMQPRIFKCSKINLNMTNRPFKSGIPLRVFDIMGSGGFLISNYQPELAELFVPGEDIVLYDSIPDLLIKIEYDLEHKDERIQIAKNGYEKVKKYHSYDVRLEEMLRFSL
ncbi:MAG: glycosyltransferase [Lachnospiraceae bacterium]|nr:glycosyltransferase [Lachnospiraceae bacterium]